MINEQDLSLWVDSHNGTYMYKLAWESLNDTLKEQARQQGFNAYDEEAIQDTESEMYYEAFAKLENLCFEWEGDKYILFCNEDIWAIKNPEKYNETDWEEWLI